jgi:hypothetical protein
LGFSDKDYWLVAHPEAAAPQKLLSLLQKIQNLQK